MSNGTIRWEGFSMIIKRWVLIAIGIGLAAHIVDGIHYDTGWTLFWTVIVLSLFNIILKPILILFALPFVILTFGIGIWIINALLFFLVAKLIPGFEVDNFWAALWGALIVSLVSLLANTLLQSKGNGGSRNDTPPYQSRDREKIDKDDAIDI